MAKPVVIVEMVCSEKALCVIDVRVQWGVTMRFSVHLFYVAVTFGLSLLMALGRGYTNEWCSLGNHIINHFGLWDSHANI